MMYTKENLKYNQSMFNLSDEQYDIFCNMVITESIPVYEALEVVRGNKPKPQQKKETKTVSYQQKKVTDKSPNTNSKTDWERIWDFFILPINHDKAFCVDEVAQHTGVPREIVSKRISEFKKAFLLIPSGKASYKGRDGSPVTMDTYKASCEKPFSEIANELESVKSGSSKIPKTLKDINSVLLLKISDRYLTEEERHEVIVETAKALLDFVTNNPQVKYEKNRYKYEDKSLVKVDETLEILRKMDKNV